MAASGVSGDGTHKAVGAEARTQVAVRNQNSSAAQRRGVFVMTARRLCTTAEGETMMTVPQQ